jgi:hypothetical protein
MKIKLLIQCAQEYEQFWGLHAHLSKVTDKNLTNREAKHQVDMAQAHTNYHVSMIAEDLLGVMNMDEPTDIIHPVSGSRIGSLMLRYILLSYLKMQDNHPMIAVVHQADISQPTYVVIPNTPEAERMVRMMNKNLPTFLWHMLLEQGLPE